MPDCLFCKIANKEIASKVVFENDELFAFHDISPQAPVHVLIIPKKHFGNLNEVTEPDSLVLSQMLQTAQSLAKQFKIAETGYRTVINTNAQGGQTVYHLHLHLLGGKQLGGSMVG